MTAFLLHYHDRQRARQEKNLEIVYTKCHFLYPIFLDSYDWKFMSLVFELKTYDGYRFIIVNIICILGFFIFTILFRVNYDFHSCGLTVITVFI